MNIKKIIGLGLLAAFISCQGSSQALNCAVQPSNGGVQPAPASDSKIYVVVKNPQGNQGTGSSSATGHVHTADNKAGGQAGGSSSNHQWTSPNGESHLTEESTDKQKNVHQIHRWTDKNKLSHETDHWTDQEGSVHQCHRWIDAQGSTHEAVHVTKPDGTVASEHFLKDKNGKVSKVDEGQHPKPQGQATNANHHPSPEPVITAGSSSGSIVHSANCVASGAQPNLSTHS